MKSAIALFVIALFVLLPLYELVDYNEQWPNDGHFMAIIFTILFIVEIPRILRTVIQRASADLSIFWKIETATGSNIVAYAVPIMKKIAPQSQLMFEGFPFSLSANQIP